MWCKAWSCEQLKLSWLSVRCREGKVLQYSRDGCFGERGVSEMRVDLLPTWVMIVSCIVKFPTVSVALESIELEIFCNNFAPPEGITKGQCGSLQLAIITHRGSKVLDRVIPSVVALSPLALRPGYAYL